MSRIILTGATDFIGRHVLRELAGRGHEVHALGRSPVREGGATWHRCDLLVPGAAAPLVRALRADGLVHLAWNATPGAFWTARTISTGSRRRCNCFARLPMRAVAGPSSSAPAPSTTGPPSCSSRTRHRCGRTLYGRAKRAAGELLLDAGAAQPVAVAWGRLFFVYGPGEPAGARRDRRPARRPAGRLHRWAPGARFHARQGRGQSICRSSRQ